MAMTEKLQVVINAVTDDFEKGFEKVNSTLQKTVDKHTKSTKELKESWEKAGEYSTKALKVAAGAFAAVGGALVASVVLTEDYRKAQAQLATAFDAAGKNAEVAKTAYDGLYRVLGDTDKSVEAASHLATLVDSERELAEYTKICQGVYATFNESLPIEGLTEAINHTSKLGEVQGVLADALEWSGVNVEDFNAKLAACNDESEREALIRQTLIDLYGEASEEYEKYASELIRANEAQAKFDEAMASIGETMQPVLTDLKLLAADVLVQLQPYLQEFAEKYLPDIRDALSDVGTKIGEAITWIADNWETITTLGTVLLGTAVAIKAISTAIAVVNAVQAIWNSHLVSATVALIAKTVASTAETAAIYALIIAEKLHTAATVAATAATSAFGAVIAFITSPIGIAVAAIAALIAIIVLCVKNWDKISETISKVCENIKGWVSDMKEKVVGKFTEIKEGITNKITELKTNIGLKFDEIKGKITKPVEDAKEAVGKVVDKIKGFFNFQWSLPDLKTPHFSISPSGWKVGDLLKGTIPKLGVSWYAEGGVFDAPTLFNYGNGSLGGLGEDGAEAIVPLEKNTQWLDKIADRLAARQADVPVVIEVDGNVFGKTAIKTINHNTRQTGKLALDIL